MFEKLWNRLTRVDVIVSLASVAGIGGVMTFIGKWLADQVDFIAAQGWAAVTLVGIGLGLLTVIAFSLGTLGAVAFGEQRRRRRLETLTIEQPTQTLSLFPPSSFLAVEMRTDNVEGQLARIDEELRTALIRIDTMNGTATVQAVQFEERLAENLEEMSQHQKSTEIRIIEDNKNRLEGTRDGILSVIQELMNKQEYTISQVDNLQNHISYMNQVRDAESTMIELDEDADKIYEKISKPERKNYNSWEQWQQDYEEWHGKIKNFWSIVEKRTENPANIFASIPVDHTYPSSVPSVELFRTHIQRHHYFTLLLVNERHVSARLQAFRNIRFKVNLL